MLRNALLKITILLALAAFALAACDKKEEAAPSTAAPAAEKAAPVKADAPASPVGAAKASPLPPAAVPAPAPPAGPTVRTKLDTWRRLLMEAPRAEVDARGLLIDMGTADQHKYTQGGWGVGWGKNARAKDGTTYVGVVGRSVPLRLYVADGGAREAVVRLRSSVPGQGVAVLIDEKTAGSGEVGRDWTVVRVPLTSQKLEPGWRTVNLFFRKKAPSGPRAEVDYVWFSTEAGKALPPAGPRVTPIVVGGRPRRALDASTTRTYKFFLHPPKGGSLVFDYGSEGATNFVVSAHQDGEVPQELFRAAATAGVWTEAKVDLAPFAGKAIRLDFEASGEAAAGWGDPEIMVPPSKPLVDPDEDIPTAKNVVYILIDTQRWDVFEAYGDKGKGIDTPAYDKFIAEGTVFTNAYDNENWTNPSVASHLTGLYPTTHGLKGDGGKLSQDVEMMSERLRSNGFKTGAFIANGHCSGPFGFEQGWDFYRNYIRENRKSEAEYVYRDTLQWIEKNKDKRFYAYVQTIDPHVTYKVAQEYYSRYHHAEYTGPLGKTVTGQELADVSRGKMKGLTKADYDWIRALYYGETTYHDEQMGLFFDKLKEMGLWENTIVVVTNDHGEELGEHGRWGHGHSLYDELIRLPLAIHFPGVFDGGTKVHEIVESVDLFPTVLEVLGLPPSTDVDGLSLVALMQGRPFNRPYYAVSEFEKHRRSVRAGRYKLITGPGQHKQLFDLVEDPGETKDVKADRPIARRLCDIYLNEAVAVPAKPKRQLDMVTSKQFQGGKAEIDPELKKQLEALGYMGGGLGK